MKNNQSYFSILFQKCYFFASLFLQKKSYSILYQSRSKSNAKEKERREREREEESENNGPDH